MATGVQHSGLVAARRRSFQGSAHQRCRVHFARNLLAGVPKAQAVMLPTAGADVIWGLVKVAYRRARERVGETE